MSAPRPTTHHILRSLPGLAASAYKRLTDKYATLNPHIPHLRGDQLPYAFLDEEAGLTTVLQRCESELKQWEAEGKDHCGVVQTTIAGQLFLYVRNPDLQKQILEDHHDDLKDGETGPIHQQMYEGESLVGMSTGNPIYKHRILHVQKQLFTELFKGPLDTRSPLIQGAVNRKVGEKIEESKGAGFDLSDFIAIVAMTVMGESQLGLIHFPDKYKIFLKNLTREATLSLAEPTTFAFLSIGKLPTLNALDQEGVEIIKEIISYNKIGFCKAISLLLGETINPEDVDLEQVGKHHGIDLEGDRRSKHINETTKKVFYFAKFLLIGGGISTSMKALFWFTIMLSEPNNQHHVQELRKELQQAILEETAKFEAKLQAALQANELKEAEAIQEKLNKGIDLSHLTLIDFLAFGEDGNHRFKNLRGFAFETLRLWPSFSVFRREAGKDINLKDKHGKTICVPKGAIIALSVYHAHRDLTSIFGADAPVFNPTRWWKNEDLKDFSLQKMKGAKTILRTFNTDRICPGRGSGAMAMLTLGAALVPRVNVVSSISRSPEHSVGFTLEYKSPSVRFESLQKTAAPELATVGFGMR